MTVVEKPPVEQHIHTWPGDDLCCHYCTAALHISSHCSHNSIWSITTYWTWARWEMAFCTTSRITLWKVKHPVSPETLFGRRVKEEENLFLHFRWNTWNLTTSHLSPQVTSFFVCIAYFQFAMTQKQPRNGVELTKQNLAGKPPLHRCGSKRAPTYPSSAKQQKSAVESDPTRSSRNHKSSKLLNKVPQLRQQSLCLCPFNMLLICSHDLSSWHAICLITKIPCGARTSSILIENL